MNLRDAERELAEAEVVPCVEAPLDEAKRLRDACLVADIPAFIASDPGCQSCGPKVQLYVRPPDVPRVAALMRDDWAALAAREGTLEAAPAPALDPEAEPACPACGATDPLVAGACPGCGLVLG
jgi:hypothetical protein